jgi:hAT family C-terminal dimerisation region
VNSSPQQNELFKSRQNPSDRQFRGKPSGFNRPVGLIQDVKTRWSSSYYMLERAWEVRIAIRKWLQLPENQVKYAALQIKDAEWEQVDELLNILQPMEQVTALMGATKSVTVHAVFRLFNHVFSCLEGRIEHWGSSGKAHATEYLTALNAARVKLTKYYSRTDGSRGTIYNLATFLDPHTKTMLYSDRLAWGSTLRRKYVDAFHSYFRENYASAEQLQQATSEPIAARPAPVILEGLAAIGALNRPQPPPKHTALQTKDYLDTPAAEFTTDNTTGDPLKVWPLLESSYPELSLMAKDILAVPASGVGVEREFNQARDVITFRRCRLTPSLTEDLMMVKHFESQPDSKAKLLDIVRKTETQGNLVALETVGFSCQSDNTIHSDPVESDSSDGTDEDIGNFIQWSDSEEHATSDCDSDREGSVISSASDV